MKERNPFKEDAICHPDKWTNMEGSCQYLKELAMLMWFIMTWTTRSCPKIQMKSSVHEPCSESLYRAHHQHTPTPSFVVETWKDDDRKMVDELASQLWNREEVSLHPYGTASWLQKSCHGKFSNSKIICSTPPLYKAVPQVLEIRDPLLKREDIHYGANAVSLVFHREDTRKWDGKSISALEVWVSELKGKKITKRETLL